MPSKKILIVDDSGTDRQLIQSALASQGYQLSTATDGEEAFQKALSEKPDLILLDVVMPKKNGFQVCRQIKNTSETRGIKVILVTSKSQETDRYWGMRQGADDYLTKPFDDEELTATVSKYL